MEERRRGKWRWKSGEERKGRWESGEEQEGRWESGERGSRGGGEAMGKGRWWTFSHPFFISLSVSLAVPSNLYVTVSYFIH